ncbi:senescence associated gene 20 [Cajanus cajan]|nr:senescence associated gene 20 [Cajanus cajan]
MRQVTNFLPRIESKKAIAICLITQHIPELANSESQERLALEEYVERNKRVVTELYKALTSEQTQPLHGLVAQDLEWWFHGPPHHRHHLVPWLTGSSLPSAKALVPEHVVGFGPVVIAEGFDEAHLVWWVHAWTVSDDGLITQVKEYVNTSVTVTRLSQKVLPNASKSKCQCIWQSRLCDESVPGLILAI